MSCLYSQFEQFTRFLLLSYRTMLSKLLSTKSMSRHALLTLVRARWTTATVFSLISLARLQSVLNAAARLVF